VPRPPGRRFAAFFDLDKTVIARSSTLVFGRPFYQGGLINRRAVLKSSYAQFVYQVSGADADQMDRMRNYLKNLCAGWDVEQVKDIVAETLHDLIDPLIYDEAAALIEEHHRADRDVVIVSSSGMEVVGPIGVMLGADRVVATEMVIENGRYSGAIARYVYGEAKADVLRELAASNDYDLAACYAYSDSITDLPMLAAVGHPTAVNPDRSLRRVAAERGWPVREFARPVHLRSRLPRLPAMPGPPSTTVTGAAVGVVAAAAGLAWISARHWASRYDETSR
jgi:HAD superfamily hydrolase (TIGR01490 family)